MGLSNLFLFASLPGQSGAMTVYGGGACTNDHLHGTGRCGQWVCCAVCIGTHTHAHHVHTSLVSERLRDKRDPGTQCVRACHRPSDADPGEGSRFLIKLYKGSMSCLRTRFGLFGTAGAGCAFMLPRSAVAPSFPCARQAGSRGDTCSLKAHDLRPLRASSQCGSHKENHMTSRDHLRPKDVT